MNMGSVILCFLIMLGSVSAHGYLRKPASRNVITTNNYCPQCLNAGGPSAVSGSGALSWPQGRHGICGDPYSGQKMHEYPNYIGDVQDVYEEGGKIDIDIVITANHWGRFSFSICPLSNDDPASEAGTLSEGCFSRYQLRKNSGDQYFYIPANAAGATGGGEQRYSMQYILPSGLTCERCVLQWKWTSANSCLPPGMPLRYRPSNSLQKCTDSEAPYPEEFWNCADIKIVSRGGDTSGQTPLPPPPPSPSLVSPPPPSPMQRGPATTIPNPPPPAPTPIPTPTPTPIPTPTPTPDPYNQERNCRNYSPGQFLDGDECKDAQRSIIKPSCCGSCCNIYFNCDTTSSSTDWYGYVQQCPVGQIIDENNGYCVLADQCTDNASQDKVKSKSSTIIFGSKENPSPPPPNPTQPIPSPPPSPSPKRTASIQFGTPTPTPSPPPVQVAQTTSQTTYPPPPPAPTNSNQGGSEENKNSGSITSNSMFESLNMQKVSDGSGFINFERFNGGLSGQQAQSQAGAQIETTQTTAPAPKTQEKPEQSSGTQNSLGFSFGSGFNRFSTKTDDEDKKCRDASKVCKGTYSGQKSENKCNNCCEDYVYCDGDEQGRVLDCPKNTFFNLNSQNCETSYKCTRSKKCQSATASSSNNFFQNFQTKNNNQNNDNKQNSDASNNFNNNDFMSSFLNGF